MKRAYLIAAGGSLVIAITVGAMFLVRRSHKASPKPAPVAATQPAELNLAGHVEPRNVVAVAAPIQGILETWFVEPGQEVYKDQLLGRVRSPQLENAAQQAQFQLDQASSKIAIENGEVLAAKLEVSRAGADQNRAHAEIDVAEKAYNRQKGLWDAGATPRLAYEKAERDYKDAKAALEKIDAAAKQAADHVASVTHDLDAANQAVVEKTEAVEKAKAALTSGDIHSPADGVMLARKGNTGDPVDPSMQDLAQIATELTSWQVLLPISPSISAKVHAGQNVSVHLGDDDLTGTVRSVNDSGVMVDFTTPNPVTKLDLIAQVKIK